MSATNNVFEVAVLSGLHAGATVRLDGKSHIVVGRDIACDIMLRDKSVADRHLMLVVLDHKLSVVALTDAVEIDGQSLPSGKTRMLRNGAIIALGDVSIGIGEPGFVAQEAPQDAKSPPLVRAKLAGLRWLSAKPLHLKLVKASVLSVALALALAAVAIPFHQWWVFPRITTPTLAERALDLKRVLTAQGAGELTVKEVVEEHNLVVAGYVARETERLRLEAVIASTRLKPIVRIFSDERIEQDARLYAKKYLPSATVWLSGTGTVAIGHGEPLRPQYRTWLTDALLRDIPGLREVLYDGPAFSRVQELLPAPYSIVSVDNLSFLIDNDGARYFSGSMLTRDIRLHGLGRKTIFVERIDQQS
ncbi:FHA domain-containing protein [Pandoraea sp. NPDC087047]|uniref:FHA domain-containing protein n=1 Tax=Pandoraea sp. NPDC087047 TaxID=3364390 RepID=UPI0038128D4F